MTLRGRVEVRQQDAEFWRWRSDCSALAMLVTRAWPMKCQERAKVSGYGSCGKDSIGTACIFSSTLEYQALKCTLFWLSLS